MRLTVDKITDIGADYAIHFAPEELNPPLTDDPLHAEGPFCEGVCVAFGLSRVGQRIFLNGDIATRIEILCGRCLKAIRDKIDESFSLALNLDFSVQSETKEELELDEDQINRIPVVDGEVNLRPVLLEQLLLCLPLYPLCDEACAGLCPSCGADLNMSQCNCQPIPFNNRFGQLKDLKLNSL